MLEFLLRWLRNKRPITSFDCRLYGYSIDMSMGCQTTIKISATPEAINAVQAYFNKGCPVRITIEELPAKGGKGYGE